MEPRTIATLQALARVTLGTALMTQPQRAGAVWVGRDAERPASRIFASAMGARDVGIGAGLLTAQRHGGELGPWLAAGILADAADLVATIRHRSELPGFAVGGIGLMAGGAVLLGAWLQAQLD